MILIKPLFCQKRQFFRKDCRATHRCRNNEVNVCRVMLGTHKIIGLIVGRFLPFPTILGNVPVFLVDLKIIVSVISQHKKIWTLSSQFHSDITKDWDFKALNLFFEKCVIIYTCLRKCNFLTACLFVFYLFIIVFDVFIC